MPVNVYSITGQMDMDLGPYQTATRSAVETSVVMKAGIEKSLTAVSQASVTAATKLRTGLVDAMKGATSEVAVQANVMAQSVTSAMRTSASNSIAEIQKIKAAIKGQFSTEWGGMPAYIPAPKTATNWSGGLGGGSRATDAGAAGYVAIPQAMKEAKEATIVQAKQLQQSVVPIIQETAVQSANGLKGVFGSLKSEFGKGSMLGQSLKLLAGAGPILALSLATSAFANLTKGLLEFTNEVRKGEKEFWQLKDQFMESLPILGSVYKGFENIAEMITHTKEETAKAVAEQQKYLDQLADLKRIQREIKDQNAQAGSARREMQDQMNLLGVTGWRKEFMRIDQANRDRVTGFWQGTGINALSADDQARFNSLKAKIGMKPTVQSADEIYQAMLAQRISSYDSKNPTPVGRKAMYDKSDLRQMAQEARKQAADQQQALVDWNTNIKQPYDQLANKMANASSNAFSLSMQSNVLAFAEKFQVVKGAVNQGISAVNQFADAMDQLHQKNAQTGRELKQALMTPTERMNAMANTLKNLFGAGHISFETMKRGWKDAQDQARQAIGADIVRSPMEEYRDELKKLVTAKNAGLVDDTSFRSSAIALADKARDRINGNRPRDYVNNDERRFNFRTINEMPEISDPLNDLVAEAKKQTEAATKDAETQKSIKDLLSGSGLVVISGGGAS